MRGRVIAAVCAAVLGVAGCTSNTSGQPDDRSASPSGSIFVSPASTAAAPIPSIVTTGPNVRPGEKPPVLDAIGRTNTNAGALASADFWFRALDWAYATTNAALVKPLYLSACKECARFVAIFDEAQQKLETLRGGRIHLQNSAIVSTAAQSAAIDVTFQQGPVREIDACGHVVGATLGTSTVTYRTYLTWSGSKWLLSDLKQVVTR